MENSTNTYRQLNQSFSRTLIYHIGIDAGFFTEYTYMTNAMLFCLQHRIQFKLYSADANFGYSKGWSDYFAPFCEEVNDSFHHIYNTHAIPSWRKLLSRSVKQKSTALIRWKLKVIYRSSVGTLLALKTYKRRVLLNHHIKFNPNHHFYIPELGIDGDYMHAFNKMVDISWRLNKETASQCQLLKDGLQLPTRYAGCQIRGGDKITETELLSPEYYIRLIKEKTACWNVFVLTDDYQLFHQAEVLSPDINWFTLCSPKEKGYVNSTFTQTADREKQEQMTRFLASMHILQESSLFIGSITPGPSMFLLKRLFPNSCPADCPTADFKRAITLPITGRSEIAARYMRS